VTDDRPAYAEAREQQAEIGSTMAGENHIDKPKMNSPLSAGSAVVGYMSKDADGEGLKR
jgi:hypothetical protein